MPAMTPREIMTAALRHRPAPRLPRDVWWAPWGSLHHPQAVRAMQERWPNDVVKPPSPFRPSSRVSGDPYVLGTSVDAWGCEFVNLQAGIHGEVRRPQLTDLPRWRETLRPPWETLPADPAAARAQVDAFCAAETRYVRTWTGARPWERYQFLRGTEHAMADIAESPDLLQEVLAEIHRFDLAEIDFWCSTAVDGIAFMDDWGSQQSLLISPRSWRRLFKPLYAEYVRRIHAAGKAAFMHSDGNIAAIYPDLVEIGIDALNSQVFCMDAAALGGIAGGRMAFWGEIDRQGVLPSADPAAGRAAVRHFARHLWRGDGGAIVQFEFGAGADPGTAAAVLEEWDRVQTERLAAGASSAAG